MSKESKQLSKLLGDDLNKIDKDRIMSRVEQTYGMRIAELTDILKEISHCNRGEGLPVMTVIRMMETIDRE